MKKLLSLIFIFIGAVALVACKPEEKPDVPKPDPKPEENLGERIDFGDVYTSKSKIRVWIDDEKGDYMEELIAEFNKIYPDIVVEHQHMGTVESRELLKTFGPSGNGADIFQFPHDHMAQAILEDLVYPLPAATQAVLKERSHELGLSIATLSYDETNKSFDPNSPNAVERVYGVPMSVESIGLFYNTDLVDGIPETFEELIDEVIAWNALPSEGDATRTNAEAGLYGLGTSSHFADSYFMQFIYSAFGFYPFGPDLNDESAVGFVDTVEALNWMVDVFKPITTGTGDTDSVAGGTNFEQGKIPYVIAGPWNAEAYKDAGVNYKIGLMPTINGEATKTFAGAQIAAVYKYSENKEDAIKFVEFLSSDIAMELQYEYKVKLPALKPELLANIPGVNEDLELLVMSEQLKTSVPMPVIANVTYYWGPGEAMIKNVWNNDVDPEEAVVTAEESYRVSAKLDESN